MVPASNRFRISLLPRGRRGWLRLVVILTLFLLISVLGVVFMISMPGRSHTGPLPGLTAEEKESKARLEAHVNALAGDIGPRSTAVPEGLDKAARYIESALGRYDIKVESQWYEVDGVTVRNIEIERPGFRFPEEIVLVGGHYDALFSFPGANDNATGVAAVLEIAHHSSVRRFERTVRFVAFVNEEPPHFATESMGSFVYARRSKKRGENIVAMISLETIGYYSDEKGSQKYPPPFRFCYPDTGNFIGFVGNLSSRHLVRRCIASFRRHTKFPSEGVSAPGWIPGIDWSDHRSFWNAGYPALMITDTALFRYRYYHTSEDTLEKIDFESMTRVVSGIARVVEELAGRMDQ